MKKLIYLIFCLIFLGHAFDAYAFRAWVFDGLTGGTTGKLDALDDAHANWANLADGDIAFVIHASGTTEASGTYFYQYIAASGVTEDSPKVIAPDSGSGRWHLCGIVPYTIGTIGQYLDSSGTTAQWKTPAWVDADVADNITIDLATLATTLTITDNESTDENNPVVFVAGADPDGGNLDLETDGDFHYNPGTGILTVPYLYATSGVTTGPVEDPLAKWDALDADDTDWWLGTNADAGASSDDDFEFRTNATPGSNVQFRLEPDTGNATVTGDVTVTGGDITLGTTSIFSGGDTTSLNNIDAIDATTESTLEAAIDTIALAAGTLPDNTVYSADINTIVDSIVWNAAGMVSDGTQCADPATATINSGPKLYTTICTDNDASTIFGHVIMPDSWDAGTVTFELAYIQTAADTAELEWDVSAQCRGDTEVPAAFSTEFNVIDAALTGSNANDSSTSGAVTPDGTCTAGDHLYWRIQIDASGTTTAMATLHFTGVKMEYTSNVGD